MVLIDNLTANAAANVSLRPTLERIAFEGAMARPRLHELYEMFYKYGPGNGTMLSLPFDQLIEHGIGHLFSSKNSADPRAVIELANQGPFSALALSIGQAEKYVNLINPSLPLLVKVDGHFLIGDRVNYPRHSNISSVKRAVELGANAIGITFYLGGEETEEDVERVSAIIEEAHKFGKPVFMWAYTRGPLPDEMGPDSLYWCAQGISAAESLGADVVKQKFPVPVPPKRHDAYKRNLTVIGNEKGYLHSKMPDVAKILELEPENCTEVSSELHVKRLAFLANVAPNTLKIYSGGPTSKNLQKDLIDTTRIVMESGNEGRIVGRNLWARPIEQGLELAGQMAKIMESEVYHRPLKEPRFTKQY
jgi:DhnA family fructose-bisphosphate aldolase class Ia